MLLYRYRSVKWALTEITDHYFYFAETAKLNDPLEGNLNIYFQGDRAAWEGLLKNYIGSLAGAIDLYLLRADKKILQNETAIVNIYGFDDVPHGEAIHALGKQFLELDIVKEYVSLYGDSMAKCYERELVFILRILHIEAFKLCMNSMLKYELISYDDFQTVMAGVNARSFEYPDVAALKENYAENDEVRRTLFSIAEGMLKDRIEQIFLSIDEPDFLYRNAADEKGSQRRNWLAVRIEFPQMYVNQLAGIMYPQFYLTSFSANKENSSMWGNYADNHKGVCMIYESDHLGKMPGVLKKVEYGGNAVERNFFESFGRLTVKQIKGWLTGADGSISGCYKHIMNDMDAWRKAYWGAFEAKTCRKLKDWELEEEYRICLADMYRQYAQPEKRKINYNRKALKGIIFGINTSEYDKGRIVKSVLDAGYENVDFYQAEFLDQKLTIRKKMWEWKQKR